MSLSGIYLELSGIGIFTFLAVGGAATASTVYTCHLVLTIMRDKNKRKSLMYSIVALQVGLILSLLAFLGLCFVYSAQTEFGVIASFGINLTSMMFLLIGRYKINLLSVTKVMTQNSEEVQRKFTIVVIVVWILSTSWSYPTMVGRCKTRLN